VKDVLCCSCCCGYQRGLQRLVLRCRPGAQVARVAKMMITQMGMSNRLGQVRLQHLVRPELRRLHELHVAGINETCICVIIVNLFAVPLLRHAVLARQVAWTQQGGQSFVGQQMGQPSDCSDATNNIIDEEIKQIVDRAYRCTLLRVVCLCCSLVHVAGAVTRSCVGFCRCVGRLSQAACSLAGCMLCSALLILLR
jgi:hypothetical protein